MSPERRGVLAIAGAALLWSTGGLGIKAVAEPALKVACYRSAVGAVALFLLLRPRVVARTPAFLVAVVSCAACLTCFTVATKWTSAANAIFLQYSGVAWVLLFAPLVLREPLRAADAGAILVAFLGMSLCFVGELDPRGRAGDLVALLAGAFYAALVLSLRREADGSAAAAVMWGNVLAAVALFPGVAATAGPAVSARSAAVLLFLGVFQIGSAYALLVRGIRTVPAAEASLVGMLEPIVNPVWVFLFLGETPRPSTVVGGLIVVAAIAWRTAYPSRTNP